MRLTKHFTLDANRVCVRVPRDKFADEMDALMSEVNQATCILTDKDATSVDGEVVCTSHSHQISNRLWRLANIVTNEDWRSKGIGTAHLKRLVEKLKARRKGAVGLFFEVFSRTQPGISSKELAIRERRARFYESLGAVVWPGILLVPRSGLCDPPQTGNELIRMELMWLPLNGTPTDADVSDAVRYVVGVVGDIASDHSLIEQVVTQKFGKKIPTVLSAY